MFFTGKSEFPCFEMTNFRLANAVRFSPFHPLPQGPFPPLYEFTAKTRKVNGGYIDDDKVAIIDGTTGQERTFGDYHNYSGGFAATLKEMGVKEGDTVAMFCPNHVDYAPVVLATTLCGAKITPINPLYTSKEIDMVLQRSHSTVLVTHESKLDIALQSAKDCSDLIKNVVVITDSAGTAVPEGTDAFDSVCNNSSAFFQTVMNNHPTTDAFPAILPYSSGTTGLPKGVCLSHNNIVSQLQQIDFFENPVFPPEHKCIVPLPFFHAYAFVVSMLYAAWKGNTLITQSGRFDLEFFCKQVQEHRPERAHLVPPIILNLAKKDLVGKYDMSSLKMILSAAAPLSKEIEDAVWDRLEIGVKQAWGMSELSPLGTMNTDDNRRVGSIGEVVPSTQIKVIDDDGNSLGAEEEGELLVKGPQTMMGYLVCR